MSVKNKKQFGVWMDSQHAIVVGRDNSEEGNFEILGHEKSDGQAGNSNEKTGNNADNNALQKLFKNVSTHMQNVDEVHVTGTGTVQEQFISYLAKLPQYKNAVATESTSNKMSDENLLEYISARFN
jgi:stalled ribosome rescue protein Dom34